MAGNRRPLEATGRVAEPLAQGYLPLDADGRKAMLTNSPRAIRGGFAAFILSPSFSRSFHWFIQRFHHGINRLALFQIGAQSGTQFHGGDP